MRKFLLYHFANQQNDRQQKTALSRSEDAMRLQAHSFV